MEPRPELAIDVKVGSLAGWQVSKMYDTDGGTGVLRLHQVVFFFGDMAASIVQMWAGDSPNEADFWRIVNSFQVVAANDSG